MTDEQLKEHYEYCKMRFLDHGILEPWERRESEEHTAWKETYERLRTAFVAAADAHHQATMNRMIRKRDERKRNLVSPQD